MDTAHLYAGGISLKECAVLLKEYLLYPEVLHFNLPEPISRFGSGFDRHSKAVFAEAEGYLDKAFTPSLGKFFDFATTLQTVLILESEEELAKINFSLYLKHLGTKTDIVSIQNEKKQAVRQQGVEK